VCATVVGQIIKRARREGRRKGKGIHPKCGPLKLFSNGCPYAGGQGTGTKAIT